MHSFDKFKKSTLLYLFYFTFVCLLLSFCVRRVHITQATLDYLQGEYEVEAGNGASRNQYLRDHCVTTYFIVPPARRRKVFKRASACPPLTSVWDKGKGWFDFTARCVLKTTLIVNLSNAVFKTWLLLGVILLEGMLSLLNVPHMLLLRASVTSAWVVLFTFHISPSLCRQYLLLSSPAVFAIQCWAFLNVHEHYKHVSLTLTHAELSPRVSRTEACKKTCKKEEK